MEEAYNALAVEVQGLRVLLNVARDESAHQERVNNRLRAVARDWKLAYQDVAARLKRTEDALAKAVEKLEASHQALTEAERSLTQIERRRRRSSTSGQ